MTVYTLRIDGRDVAGTEGQTIMDVAEENGIDIPGLCHLQGIHDRGACRLCMVEVAGSPRMVAACMTKVTEGMEVTAHSEKLLEHRRAVTEMIFVERNHKFFALDHNRCILCLRCVRVCDEIEGAHTWDVMHRGLETRVQADMGIPWGESPTCTSCGKCVQVCPTGALFEKGRPVAAGSKDRRPFLPWLRVVQEDRGL